jgi:hypothetical protein
MPLKLGRRPTQPGPEFYAPARPDPQTQITDAEPRRSGWRRVLFGPGNGGATAGPARSERWGQRQPLRTRALATLLWLLLAVAAGGGLLAILQAMRPAAAAPTSATKTNAVADPGAGAFGALFLQAWLPAGRGTERTLARFMPAVPDLTAVVPGTLVATGTTPVSVQPVPGPGGAATPGYWSVTVAATVAAVKGDGSLTQLGLRYYQIPVASCGVAGGPACPAGTSSPGYSAVAAPALVAGPGTYGSAGAAPGQTVTVTSAAGDTIARYLSAYLAGDGELARYCPTCTPLPAPVMTHVDVTAITATGDPNQIQAAQGASPPTEGSQLTVLVTARGVDTAGVVQTLSYPLQMVVRAGQWTVTGVTAAPPLAPIATATSSASTAPATSSPAPTTSSTSTTPPSPSATTR